MARRRGNAGSALGMAVLLAIAAVAVAGPFVIAGWALFNELRARKYRGAEKVSDLVEEEERRRIEHQENHIAHLLRQMQLLDAEGVRKGYERRSDGAFDGRRPAARDLNLRIEAVAERRELLIRELEIIRAPVERRIEAWLAARSGLVGTRAALVAFSVVFVGMTYYLAGQAGAPVTWSGLMYGVGLDPGQRVGASVAATLTAGFTMWMAGSSARSSLAA